MFCIWELNNQFLPVSVKLQPSWVWSLNNWLRIRTNWWNLTCDHTIWFRSVKKESLQDQCRCRNLRISSRFLTVTYGVVTSSQTIIMGNGYFLSETQAQQEGCFASMIRVKQLHREFRFRVLSGRIRTQVGLGLNFEYWFPDLRKGGLCGPNSRWSFSLATGEDGIARLMLSSTRQLPQKTKETCRSLSSYYGQEPW